MTFNLDNYVDVPTRLRMSLEKYPDLRVQESQPVFREIGNKLYIEIKCTVWRDKEDQLPAIAYCWEPFPGTTPYTRDSEQMNCSTSALGRALGMMGFGIDHKMASKQEVLARQPAVEIKTEVAKYDNGNPIPDPFDEKPQTTKVVNIRDPKAVASAKQLGMIRALARTNGIPAGIGVIKAVSEIIGRDVLVLEELTKGEASDVITKWKN